jgi:tRNA A37 threonylcarbamoyladenosine synthetase subunit TsaC/SUA5/YrdC
MGEPMLSATLLLPDTEVALSDAPQIRAALEHRLDLVIDSGPCGTEPSTVIDLTGEAPIVLRAGKGPLGVLGQGL